MSVPENWSYAQESYHVSGTCLFSVKRSLCVFSTFTDCDTVDDTAVLLASELLVSQLQPVFGDVVSREQFANSVFPFSDRQDPRGFLNLDEFQMLYARLIELYNILPSVCPQSVFTLCNSNDDLFITLEEVISCGSNA